MAGGAAGARGRLGSSGAAGRRGAPGRAWRARTGGSAWRRRLLPYTPPGTQKGAGSPELAAGDAALWGRQRSVGGSAAKHGQARRQGAGAPRGPGTRGCAPGAPAWRRWRRAPGRRAGQWLGGCESWGQAQRPLQSSTTRQAATNCPQATNSAPRAPAQCQPAPRPAPPVARPRGQGATGGQAAGQAATAVGSVPCCTGQPGNRPTNRHSWPQPDRRLALTAIKPECRPISLTSPTPR